MLKLKPDVVFFAGRAYSLNVLLSDADLPLPDTGLSILGGSALYEVGEYTSAASSRFPSLRFASPAYSDEWKVFFYQQQQPAFLAEYQQAFDPANIHILQPYGYSRPPGEAMLAFDAMNVLLHAPQIIQGNFKAEEIEAGLRSMIGPNSWPGITGEITFGDKQTFAKKVVLMLIVDANGKIQMLPQLQGCLNTDCIFPTI
jgi:hypothetical protein